MVITWYLMSDIWTLGFTHDDSVKVICIEAIP